MTTRASSPKLRWLAALLAAVATAGCSGQGEGELCNKSAGGAGNSDCQDNLVCTTRPAVVSGSQYGICCPVNLSQATTSACSTNAATTGNPQPTGGDASEDGPDGETEGAPGDATNDGADAFAPDGTAE